jgi:predicted alpha/beta superfamily hydrolase
VINSINVLDELEDNNINIKVESNGDSVEIKMNANKQDRHKELEELEKANTGSNDTLDKKK